MDSLTEADEGPSKPKKIDWIDKLLQAVIAGAAVFQAVQGSIVSTVILVAILILLISPVLIRRWEKRKLTRKSKEALARFTTDFLSYIDRAQTFIQSTNQYGIPYYLRAIILKPNTNVRLVNQYVEYFFSGILNSTHERSRAGFKNYQEFEQASKELNNVMEYFVLIYVDDLIRELKQSPNLSAITPQEMSGLKQRYAALNQFINEYNGFRARIASFWGEREGTLQIRIPTQTLD